MPLGDTRVGGAHGPPFGTARVSSVSARNVFSAHRSGTGARLRPLGIAALAVGRLASAGTSSLTAPECAWGLATRVGSYFREPRRSRASRFRTAAPLSSTGPARSRGSERRTSRPRLRHPGGAARFEAQFIAGDMNNADASLSQPLCRQERASLLQLGLRECRAALPETVIGRGTLGRN